jgi:hypothetical protein
MIFVATAFPWLEVSMQTVFDLPAVRLHVIRGGIPDVRAMNAMPKPLGPMTWALSLAPRRSSLRAARTRACARWIVRRERRCRRSGPGGSGLKLELLDDRLCSSELELQIPDDAMYVLTRAHTLRAIALWPNMS